VNPSEVQTEALQYTYMDHSSMMQDMIFIQSGDNSTAIKLAFSYGLHQSVKLRDLETKMENEIWEIWDYPDVIMKDIWAIRNTADRRVIIL
jgi:uncharacterized Rmd1/YagE family protein